MTALEKRMVLHRFMCDQFGYTDLRVMLNRLAGLPQGFMENNESRFARVISAYIDPYPTGATKNDIARYDANIIAHSQALGMVDEQGKSWKPFQYLALLFTERYLDLYFHDREILVEKLNKWKNLGNMRDIADYTADGIHTLAFQSATGSGKTLLLHANILQYKHYLETYKQSHKLNKIVLVTPDEGLSRQHLRELQASKIPAQIFSDNQGGEVFSRGGVVVDIIDLHKLDEKKGIKRVSLESFEENNLVMVDEGHLGTGGKVWRKRRKQLAKNGFTFEYSATFNQAVSGTGEDIKKLRDEYGKSILFDYSYKFFYEDGYGKDYKISNLQNTDDGEANNLYLLACLLMFYQQCRIYEDKNGQWREFNVAPPLWVFLGKTVTGGNTAGKKSTETDVVRIVKFLAWVQSDPQQVVRGIEKLTSDTTGLVDENGVDIFKRSFPCIKGSTPREVYDHLLLTVFRAKGQVHISHLTGSDELQLSAGDANPFGVINVGNTSGLYAKLEAVENALFLLSKNAFTQPLFADVDNYNSPVNIVIGARKFAAGWNSWRVSTMGLMHVGAGEGPQIIQMFGRGVRLKGIDMSLKRHTAIEGANPRDGDQLKLLETLNIFGLKANYMDKFKEYLQKEGVKIDRVSFTLPTRKQFKGVKGLKILKMRDTAGEFKHSGRRFALLDLSAQSNGIDAVTLDRCKRLQVVASNESETDGDTIVAEEEHKLAPKHLNWINKQAVYHKVLQRKRRFSWHNMEISQEMVDELLENNDWYHLYIPSEKLEPSHYGRVREWENLAVDLISEYADQRWKNRRNTWEQKYMEAAPLNEKNLNYINEYNLAVDIKKEDLIRNIEQFVERVSNGDYSQGVDSDQVKIALLAPNFHAYIPLLHVNKQEFVQITPVPLNDGEAGFVKCLKDVVENCNADFLRGKEMYLMRNMSRSKGISFFEDYTFYPDFILWVKDSNRQDILFIDPKGLAYFNSITTSKVGLHKKIKKVEEKIKKKNPKLFLHSYIWSNTQPRNMGTDKSMSVKDCHDMGIFISSRSNQELIDLLRHALAQT